MIAGDYENMIAALTPGGIEAQEKRGQLKQAAMQTLPRQMGSHRQAFEKLGFKFGKNVDELFIEATFPKGWKKQPTDHDMWSDILDDKGRKRGAIFYKAAFYDQKAQAHLDPRFSVREDYGKETRTVRVHDECGLVDKKIVGLVSPNWNDREKAIILQAKIDKARKSLEEWLNKEYPKWDNVLAHWNHQP